MGQDSSSLISQFIYHSFWNRYTVLLCLSGSQFLLVSFQFTPQSTSLRQSHYSGIVARFRVLMSSSPYPSRPYHFTVVCLVLVYPSTPVLLPSQPSLAVIGFDSAGRLHKPTYHVAGGKCTVTISTRVPYWAPFFVARILLIIIGFRWFLATGFWTRVIEISKRCRLL